MPRLGGKLSAVLRTIEAEVDSSGRIHPKESIELAPGSRVLVTILPPDLPEGALLSQAALAADWDRPEEEAAWAHLSQG